MSRYAIVQNGVVVNVAKADAPLTEEWIEAGNSVDIGWTWNGSGFAAPDPVPEPVPAAVTRFQALAALSNAGLLSSAQAAVDAAGGLTKLAWDNALVFERSSPTLNALAAALNLSSGDLDDLFRAAALIEA